MAKSLLLLTLVGLLLFGYQNCAVSSSHSALSSVDILSADPCAPVMAKAFKDSYYMTFRQQCTDCHDTGAGFGHFANSDFSTAFNQFESVGRAMVEHNFLDPKHQPPHTGTQNQPVVDAAKPIWAAAEQNYAICQTAYGVPLAITTGDETNAGIFTSTASRGVYSFQHVEWDLTKDVPAALQGKIQLILGIDIRMATAPVPPGTTPPANPTPIGYEFRNPTARVVAGSGASYEIRGLHIVINDSLDPYVSTYALLDDTVNSETNVVLQSGALALAAGPVQKTDMFALKIDGILDGSGQPINFSGDSGSGGAPGSATPTVVTYSQLAGGDPVLGVFSNNCFVCHNATTLAGGMDLTSYAQAVSHASLIETKINDGTMPPTGMLPASSINLIENWINNGKPQ